MAIEYPNKKASIAKEKMMNPGTNIKISQ